jgi:hypothetical protein
MRSNFKKEKLVQPYKHLILENCYKAEDLLYIEKYISQSISWKLHTENFYEQYEYKMNFKNKEEKIFFSYAYQFKKLIEQEFAVSLSDEIEIVAHRLVKDQHIAIHNDSPILGRETHRLVVNLNNNYKDTDGGHFYICRERNSESIENILRPISNSGFAFEACKNSFHAVGKVLNNERLSIVYSFWHIANTPSIKERIKDIIKVANEKHANQISQVDLNFLESMGFQNITLVSNNLKEHLIDTYALLRQWGEGELICELGLFHSILGTTYFKNETDKISFVEEYFTNRTTLLNLIKGYSIFDIEKASLQPTFDEIIFIKVYFANLITGKINARFTPRYWDNERLLFQNYNALLTDTAKDCIKSALNITD